MKNIKIHPIKLKKSPKGSIPIKYLLSVPVIKADLRDSKGNEIKDILSIQYFNGGIVVLTKEGLYMENPTDQLKKVK